MRRSGPCQTERSPRLDEQPMQQLDGQNDRSSMSSRCRLSRSAAQRPVPNTAQSATKPIRCRSGRTCADAPHPVRLSGFCKILRKSLYLKRQAATRGAFLPNESGGILSITDKDRTRPRRTRACSESGPNPGKFSDTSGV